MNIDSFKLISSCFIFRVINEPFSEGSPIAISDLRSDGSLLADSALIFDNTKVYYDMNLIVRYKKTFKPLSKKYTKLTRKFNNFQFESHFKEIYDSMISSFEMWMGHNEYDCINNTKKVLARIEQYYFHFIEKDLMLPGQSNPISILSNLSSQVFTEPENLQPFHWYNEFILSEYYKSQKYYVDQFRQYVTGRIYKKKVSKDDLYPPSILKWNATDTDLLELVVALLESNSVIVEDRKLSRKELLSILSKVFGKEIKNSESLLSRATERYEPRAKYLNKLASAFEDYCIKKDQN